MGRYPTYFSLSECARYVGLTREKIRQEILQGELTASIYQRPKRSRYRVELEDLRAYCRSHGCDQCLALLASRYPPAA